MAVSILSMLLCCATCYLVAAENFVVSTFRNDVHPANLQQRQTGIVGSTLGKELYWYGLWDVGDAKDLKLLIDTGSTDLILNKGKYKPSPDEKRFNGHQKFETGYEGVLRDGFGFESLNGTVTLDAVSSGGLKIKSQAIGRIKSVAFEDVGNATHIKGAFTGVDGIIGFLTKSYSSFEPQADSWIQNLCHDKSISKCVFALAFGTTGKGSVLIGDTEASLFDGSLVSVPNTAHYQVQGDIVVNGDVMFTNQSIILDVGTNNIQGPLGQTKQIFRKLKYPHYELTGVDGITGGNITNSYGFFPCDKPPTLGFRFPTKYQLKPGQKQTVFNVSTSTGIWDVYDNGHNNCTSILGGTTFLNDPLTKPPSVSWLVGQPFFAGHYIQFEPQTNVISFADLKDASR